MSKKESKQPVPAMRTHDGLIEIVSLNVLDQLVGGMLSPDSAFCQLEQTEITEKPLNDTAV